MGNRKDLMIYLRLVRESMLLAFNELRVNQLRTFLSLLGITIGIFCVITVLTVVDNLKSNVSDSLSKIGENVIYVQKWPWTFGPGYEWWDFWKRPNPSYKEYRFLSDKLQGADKIAVQIDFHPTMEYLNYSDDYFSVGVTYDYADIYGFEFDRGRYFSKAEMHSGEPLMVIGYELAEELFPPHTNPVGKVIKADGRRFEIVGVLKKEGESLLGSSFDEAGIIPFNYARTFLDTRSLNVNIQIPVKAKENVSLEALKDELRGLMRRIRKLRPKEKDDFALNQMTMLTAHTDGLFSVLNFAGWFIGGFAILVGGFGIANIMFVSVRERTNIIGIKKALGAKSLIILLEFLLESIMLCLIGGTLGLLLVLGTTLIANTFFEDITFYLTLGNIYTGLLVSTIIGVIAGIWPAYIASRMDPVTAIRFK